MVIKNAVTLSDDHPHVVQILVQVAPLRVITRVVVRRRCHHELHALRLHATQRIKAIAPDDLQLIGIRTQERIKLRVKRMPRPMHLLNKVVVDTQEAINRLAPITLDLRVTLRHEPAKLLLRERTVEVTSTNLKDALQVGMVRWLVSFGRDQTAAGRERCRCACCRCSSHRMHRSELILCYYLSPDARMVCQHSSKSVAYDNCGNTRRCNGSLEWDHLRQYSSTWW